MCSSASTAVCTLITLLPPECALPDSTVLTDIMHTAAKMHSSIRQGGEQQLTVFDVISRSRLPEWLASKDTPLDLYEVGGLVTDTPTDMW